LGCQKYHEYQFGYDHAYVDYLQDKDQTKWDHPERLDILEIEKIRVFLNEKWRARMQMIYMGHDLKPELKRVLQDVLPSLNTLRGATLCSTNFDDSEIRLLIINAFDAVAKYGPRTYESTGASKILHTINPELFVMWDTAIRQGYGLGEDHANKKSLWKREGKGYVHYFLPRMQRIAHLAIRQAGAVSDDPIELLKTPDCSHGIAKLLDEYNYAKFTTNDDRIWKKEYRP
jgi:hypothetical protein